MDMRMLPIIGIIARSINVTVMRPRFTLCGLSPKSSEIDIAKLSPTQLNSALFDVFSNGSTITTSVAFVCANVNPTANKLNMTANIVRFIIA